MVIQRLPDGLVDSLGRVFLDANKIASTANQPASGMVLTHSWGIYYWPDGFRGTLDRRLREQGRPVRWIGTQFNQNAPLDFPPTVEHSAEWMSYAWNESHGGATMATSAAALAGYLASAGVPDFSIVLLGTNDVLFYAPLVLATTITVNQAVAAMQASMASIITQFLNAGTKYVFVCDMARTFPPPIVAYQSEADAITDAWNLALPAFLAQFGQHVKLIEGLQKGTLADMMLPITGTHPNRNFDNQIGKLIADAVQPYLAPDALPVLPRRVEKLGPATTCFGTIALTDHATLPYLAGLKPPGGGSFARFLDWYAGSFMSDDHCVHQYADDPADGLLIVQRGQTLSVVLMGNYVLTDVPIALGEWHRLCFFADATTGWVGLGVNGIVVASAKPAPWNIVANQTTYFGYVSTTPMPASQGAYSRFSAHQGPNLPSFDKMVQAIEDDYYDGARCPGLTAELLFDQSIGIVETITGTAGAGVGTYYPPLWIPKPSDQETDDRRPARTIVASEASNWKADTNYYEVNAGLGLAEHAGSLHAIVRRTVSEIDAPGAVQNIVGCVNFPLTHGGALCLYNPAGGVDQWIFNGVGMAAAPAAATPQEPGLDSIIVLSLSMGNTGAAFLSANGARGAAGDTTGYSEVGSKSAVGVLPLTHAGALNGATLLGFAVSTQSTTAEQEQALLSDVARVGPERALRNLYLANLSVWVPGGAGATWAPIVGSGPTFTRTGTIKKSPIYIPVWGRS